MTLVLSVLIFATLIGLLAKGAAPFLSRMLSLYERRIVLEEQKANAPVSAPPKIESPPVALLERALQHSEPWAREQTVQAMYEAYENAGRDWNKVTNLFINRGDIS